MSDAVHAEGPEKRYDDQQGRDRNGRCCAPGRCERNRIEEPHSPAAVLHGTCRDVDGRQICGSSGLGATVIRIEDYGKQGPIRRKGQRGNGIRRIARCVRSLW